MNPLEKSVLKSTVLMLSRNCTNCINSDCYGKNECIIRGANGIDFYSHWQGEPNKNVALEYINSNADKFNNEELDFLIGYFND